jgi:enoyl-CoA hydratase/carnithine racemase
MADILFTVDGQVATITLNRPQHQNAINFEMWRSLTEICSHIETDTNVRVVVVQGNGDEAFSTGDDIAEFAQRHGDPWQAKIHSGKVEMALQSLLRLTRPTIALIKGTCVGSGCLLAAHCDLRVSADNAIFGLPVAKLGALIGHAEIQRLIHLIGAGATLDLLLSARLIDAQKARDIGLCTQLAPLAAIDQIVQELAARMARLAPLTQRWHKQMVHTLLHTPDLTDLPAEEVMLPDVCFDTEDYAEGIQAFLEKREPRFQGR